MDDAESALIAALDKGDFKEIQLLCSAKCTMKLLDDYMIGCIHSAIT
jgi:hypothetical protein